MPEEESVCSYRMVESAETGRHETVVYVAAYRSPERIEELGRTCDVHEDMLSDVIFFPSVQVSTLFSATSCTPHNVLQRPFNGH